MRLRSGGTTHVGIGEWSRACVCGYTRLCEGQETPGAALGSTAELSYPRIGSGGGGRNGEGGGWEQRRTGEGAGEGKVAVHLIASRVRQAMGLGRTPCVVA